MKLNHDCVRDVLLFIETNFDDVYTSENSLNIKIKNYSSQEINYACLKLLEAGFINGNPQPDSKCPSFMFVFSLTWRGHQFLDNIRVDESWKKTKSIISKIGSASLNIVSQVASNIAIGLINNEISKLDLS